MTDSGHREMLSLCAPGCCVSTPALPLGQKRQFHKSMQIKIFIPAVCRKAKLPPPRGKAGARIALAPAYFR